MTASRTSQPPFRSDLGSPSGSEAPPVLFRLRAMRPSAHSSATAARSHESTAMETGTSEHLVDDFPPPPPIAAAPIDRFSPPPVHPQPAIEDDFDVERSHRAVSERSDAPAGRSWSEMFGSRLMLVLMLAAVVGALFLMSRSRDDESLRIADEETDRLLAELGIDDGTAEAPAVVAPVDNANDQQDASGDGKQTESRIELASDSSDKSGKTAPTEIDDVAPSADNDLSWTEDEVFAGNAADSTSGDLGPGDPATEGVEAGTAAEMPKIATTPNSATVNEPTTINEPTAGDGFDLTAPMSPYDTRAEVDNGTQSAMSNPMAPENAIDEGMGKETSPAASANRVATIRNPPTDRTAATPQPPSQTTTPYAVTDWSRYFPPQPSASGQPGAMPPNNAPNFGPSPAMQAYPNQGYATNRLGGAIPPGAAYGNVPQVAQLPEGYPPTPNGPTPNYAPAPNSPSAYGPAGYGQAPAGYGQFPAGYPPANGSGFGGTAPPPNGAPYSPYDIPQR